MYSLDWGYCINYEFFLLQKNLKGVFDEAIMAALDPPEFKEQNGCLNCEIL